MGVVTLCINLANTATSKNNDPYRGDFPSSYFPEEVDVLFGDEQPGAIPTTGSAVEFADSSAAAAAQDEITQDEATAVGAQFPIACPVETSRTPEVESNDQSLYEVPVSNEFIDAIIFGDQLADGESNQQSRPSAANTTIFVGDELPLVFNSDGYSRISDQTPPETLPAAVGEEQPFESGQMNVDDPIFDDPIPVDDPSAKMKTRHDDSDGQCSCPGCRAFLEQVAMGIRVADIESIDDSDANPNDEQEQERK